jgi:hypothetical protein
MWIMCLFGHGNETTAQGAMTGPTTTSVNATGTRAFFAPCRTALQGHSAADEPAKEVLAASSLNGTKLIRNHGRSWSVSRCRAPRPM